MIGQLAKYAERSLTRLEQAGTWSSTPAKAAIALALLVGVAARLSPLTDPAGRLFWQFMTEDGYLMQTAARNFALGLGLSTADGTIPTNGVQPLATFVFSLMHFLSGGSKAGGIALVTILSMAISVASCFLFFRVLKRIFAPLFIAAEIAAAGAVLWFSAPFIIGHSMNGLETGLYYFFILATLDYYTASIEKPFGLRQQLSLGLLFGLTFLARNDAVFLIAALLLSHLFIGPRTGAAFKKRLADCLVAGLFSMLVASPWLINNYVFFGTIIPISGVTESRFSSFGANLSWMAANLFQATTLYAPIPKRIETNVLVIVLSLASVAIIAGAAWLLTGRQTIATRRLFSTGALFAFFLCVYYGLFFGAAHFVPRYVSALSPFMWMASVSAAAGLIALLFKREHHMRIAAAALVGACCLIAGALSLRTYLNGEDHMHRQVVEWVEENVPEDEWVGAVQTGTLGYFHDRTINLDGKVNPSALRARINGDVRGYVLETEITYIADWQGVTGWVKDGRHPAFARSFVVLVDDPGKNLGVLKRASAPEEET